MSLSTRIHTAMLAENVQIGFPEVLFVVLGLGILAIAVLSFAFWVWMLVDCLKNEALEGTEKIAWVLVILFAHWVGALIYFIVAKDKVRSRQA